MQRTIPLLAAAAVLGAGACNKDATVLRSIGDAGSQLTTLRADASNAGGVPSQDRDAAAGNGGLTGSGGAATGTGGDARLGGGGTTDRGGAPTSGGGTSSASGGASTGGVANSGGTTSNGGTTTNTGGTTSSGGTDASAGATGSGGTDAGAGGANTGGSVDAGSPPPCGNGTPDPGEGCDDGNTITERCTYGLTSCDVCDGTCQLVPGATSYCGDGAIDVAGGEACDDANANATDGCAACAIQTDWVCEGSPSVCWKDGPSCAGLPKTCGSSGTEDCCASALVTGGSFIRDNGVSGNFPATVSDFRLDKYEITVGRFRQFVAGYPANMPAGSSGKNSNIATDQGWNPVWNGAGYLPADKNALTAAVQCTIPAWQNWTVGNDNLPMNCISWYEAYAFCIWDGGRLPSELEWNYAAAGGAQQRPYPWSTSPTDKTIDASYAVYAPAASVYEIVGSTSTKGDGRWGQADLAGNVMEWVEDWLSGYPSTCADCATVDWAHANQIPAYRLTRGGSAGDDASFQLSSRRWYWNVPSFRVDVIGARCARNP